MKKDYSTEAFRLLKEILKLDFTPYWRGYIVYNPDTDAWKAIPVITPDFVGSTFNPDLMHLTFLSLRDALSALLEDVQQFCCVMPFGSYVNIDINTEIVYRLINTYNQDVVDDSFVTPVDSQLEVSEHLFYSVGIGCWYNDTYEANVDEYKHKIKLVPELFLKLIRKDYLVPTEKHTPNTKALVSNVGNTTHMDCSTLGLYLEYIKKKEHK